MTKLSAQVSNLLRPEILNALSAQSANYPIPFLFSHEASAHQQWSVKWSQFVAAQKTNLAQIEKALQHVDTTETSKKRLSAQQQACSTLLSQVEELLKDFHFTVPTLNTQAALENKISNHQHFDSYFKNIFRDWGYWGESECQVYKSYLSLLECTSGNILIVGGGSGRLLSDLVSLKKNVHVTQIDINPLLTRVAQLICSGQSVKLTEMVRRPIEFKDISKTYELELKSKINPDGFDFLIGDILDHPFKDQVFEAIVCPWVIDILPEKFADFSRRINLLLKPKGELLIFGPLSFDSLPIGHRQTLEELKETLELSGFESINSKVERVAYLDNPMEAQVRHEKLVVVHCKKAKNAKKPKTFQTYPDWIVNPSTQPNLVPELSSLQATKNLEAQFLGALLSGRTIADLADSLVKGGTGMNSQQALDFVQSVFARMVENGEIPKHNSD